MSSYPGAGTRPATNTKESTMTATTLVQLNCDYCGEGTRWKLAEGQAGIRAARAIGRRNGWSVATSSYGGMSGHRSAKDYCPKCVSSNNHLLAGAR